MPRPRRRKGQERSAHTPGQPPAGASAPNASTAYDHDLASPASARVIREDLVLSRKLAYLMDDAVKVPGTSFGLGLDAVIGLVPGIGDLTGSALSSVILYDAIRVRVPVPVLARMGWNLLFDAILGVVPFAGDVLDAAHRANRKNYRLLERTLLTHEPGRPTAGYVVAAVFLAILPLILGLVLGIVALVVLWRWITG